ncbi:MAG: hypothetical protein AAB546_00695 [Patescibacteria group bacterium]
MVNLPQCISKFFWGDKLEELDWEKHKNYIARTILERGDRDAVKWLLEKVDTNYIKNLLKAKKIDLKSANFWNIYLS